MYQTCPVHNIHYSFVITQWLTSQREECQFNVADYALNKNICEYMYFACMNLFQFWDRIFAVARLKNSLTKLDKQIELNEGRIFLEENRRVRYW